MPSFAAAAPETPMSTWYKPKKIGIWAIIGRQEANGLVPCFLYSANLLLCHRLGGTSWSFLPLVFGLKLSDIALHGAHTAHRFNLFDEKGDGEGTHNQGQADNAQHPRSGLRTDPYQWR